MTISYTTRPRTTDFIAKHLTYKNSPSPVSYKSIELNPKSGRYICSKFGDSKMAKITNFAPRFLTDKESPGPSNYRERDSLSPSAKYILSHRKGNGVRSFTKTIRKSFTD